jgi:hypothetical protein
MCQNDLSGELPHHPTSQEPHLEHTSVISYFLISDIAASVVVLAGECVPLSTSLTAVFVFCCWLFFPEGAPPVNALLNEAHNLDSVAPIFS